ncbi:xylose isomerase [Burkholderia sp. D7]|nr:xylose isomerase [Burkholderia sp. D7]
MKFAARLNSFGTRPELQWPGLTGKPTVLQLLERAKTVKGLTHVDLNYPNHFRDADARTRASQLEALGLKLNGFAMRYYSEPEFRRGSLTHPDPATRQSAIDLAKRGLDDLRLCGGSLMTFWPGQDGFEYPFHVDYQKLWDLQVQGIRELAEHAPDVTFSLEYKPNEPRAFSLLNNAGTTLLAIKELGLKNLAMTLDFGHVLYAGEQPACTAALVSKHCRLAGLHLNDAYGHRDDGMMVGSVHTIQTIELLTQLVRDGYDGVIYFDTFPDAISLDPVAETEANIKTVNAMMSIARQLANNEELRAAGEKQDVLTSQRIVQTALFGPAYA